MKYIYLLLALLMFSSVLRAQVSSENYILTKSVVASGDTLVSVQYYDGLGREQELLRKNYSDNGNKDLITLNQYDGMGNLHKSWAPVPYPSISGLISEDVICEVATNVYADAAPYTLYEYDKTESNLLCKEYGPGSLWRKNAKAKEICYGGNVANVFPMFKLSSDRNSFLFSKYYASGTLMEIKNIDEDGVSTTKYYDILGRLILEQNGSGAITYYIYDNDGNLIFVLPPAAYESCIMAKNVNHSMMEDECLKKYAYFYRYDKRGRCVEKKLPGCEPIFMIYDKDNKMIFKQDGNLRKNKEWQFMFFDSYNRPTVMGVCKDADKNNIGNVCVVSRFSTRGQYAMYDANIDLDVKKMLKVYYYDNYAFLEKDSLYNYKSLEEYDEDICHAGNKVTTHGLLTGCRTYVLSSSFTSIITSPTYHIQAFYYNDKGEVVQSHMDNGIGGIDDIYYHLNPYKGSILLEKIVHRPGSKCLGNTKETIVKRYTYDSDGRIVSLRYRLNDNDEFLVKHCEYNDLGYVAKTMSHVSALSTNYTYNVRGQLTSAINPLTEQHIYYNTLYHGGQNILAYNGNISVYEWKGCKNGKFETESYSYEYDAANRLRSAYSISQSGSEKALFGLHDTHYDYDLMGNITNITRKGINIDEEEYGYRDDASLEYDGNQLSHVVNKGYKDSSSDTQIADREYSNSAEYKYDANGNMTRNLNKGILKVVYNVLNLPEYIYMRDNEYLHNIYDGDGNKLSSERHTCKYNITVPESGSIQGNLDTLNVKLDLASRDFSETTYYVGNFIYKSKLVDLSKPRLEGISSYALGSQYAYKLMLSRINFDDGYVVPVQSKYQIYDYVKDYLGNIRFVVKNGYVVETNNYHPFGGFYNNDDNYVSQRWRFGNKELDRKVDIYSWGFRNYDPTVGSFLTVDPMCELNYKMSPYSFADNNPVNYTDLFGLKTYSWYDFVKHWHDFDVNNDDVELPQVVCTASKPFTFENAYDEFGRRLDEIEGYSRLLYKVNYNFGGSKLSQPLWNAASYIKNNYSSLGNKLNLSTFHPSYVYRGITNNINKIAKYGNMAGKISYAMNAGKLLMTGDVQASDVLDASVASIAWFFPGYGWVITGGYLVLDTGVELLTGNSIGEHLNDYFREEYGNDTVNFYNITIK